MKYITFEIDIKKKEIKHCNCCYKGPFKIITGRVIGEDNDYFVVIASDKDLVLFTNTKAQLKQYNISDHEFMGNNELISNFVLKNKILSEYSKNHCDICTNF